MLRSLFLDFRTTLRDKYLHHPDAPTVTIKRGEVEVNTSCMIEVARGCSGQISILQATFGMTQQVNKPSEYATEKLPTLLSCIDNLEGIAKRLEFVVVNGLLPLYNTAEYLYPINVFVRGGEINDEFRSLLEGQLINLTVAEELLPSAAIHVEPEGKVTTEEAA